MKGRVFAKTPPMSEEARGELLEYFREDATRLQAVIGCDLSGWLAPSARDAARHPNSSW